MISTTAVTALFIIRQLHAYFTYSSACVPIQYEWICYIIILCIHLRMPFEYTKSILY